ncbi:hypothetical protein [Salarchaeum sp. JOR-1]|uniref:hypothetical protein n=1 Tax=Salarchaeum sp. JOR-1 TaxID=2599399 RepID=UPI001198A0D0|nr:hypothetical protein [Salarchaeum sp. JOR-1]QDX40388.1 hypothetical protein FQU85_05550 [Salarchaeum sp. JOR-1]
MVAFTRENTVVAGCAAVALSGWYLLTEFTSADTASIIVLLGIGVVLPLLINGYLDSEDGE